MASVQSSQLREVSKNRIGIQKDPMTEEKRKLYNEKYPPMTDDEYREEIESVRRDRELGITEEE